jgi:hypothetical protein
LEREEEYWIKRFSTKTHFGLNKYDYNAKTLCLPPINPYAPLVTLKNLNNLYN